MISFDGEGGEFIVESSGVSWLLWVNLLVMFLLIVVLYSLTIFVSDEATSEVGQISAKKYDQLEDFRDSKNIYYSNNLSSSSCSQDIKVYKDRIINRDNASTSRRRGLREREEINEDKKKEVIKHYSAAAAANYNYNQQCNSYNPCNLLELGRRAFLKCLGLDDSSTPTQEIQGKLTDETDKSQ